MSKLKTDLRARDIMIPEPVCVEPSTGLRQLAHTFEENEISGAPVVDKQGRVVGVVSKTDLIRRCSEGSPEFPPAYLFEVLSEVSEEGEGIIPEPLICVDDFMTPDAVTATPETAAGDIAKLMHESRIHRVIIIDADRRPVGIVTSLDMLGSYPR